MERVSRRSGHLRQQLSEVPLPLRYALVVGTVAGAVGGVVGLVIGLRTYVPTAWFAILEIGAPAALLGGVVGLVVGSLTSLARGRRRRV